MRSMRTDGRVSRRFLLVAAAGALAAVASACRPRPETPGGEDPVGDTGVTPTSPGSLTAVMTALHVHASFSEGGGSMAAQLSEAAALGVRALWWTEHDWRMSANGYLSRIPFAELEAEGLRWEPDTTANTTDVGQHEVTAAGPPMDGETVPLLRLTASGGGGKRAGHRLSAHSDRGLYSTSLHGQEWALAVHLDRVQERAFLALDLLTSFRPAGHGRDAGHYRLSYRFSDHREGVQVLGHVAEIYLRAPLGRWHEALLRPAEDLSRAWPELDGRDASCTELSVAAMTWGEGEVSAHLHDLTITRAHVEGQQPLATQQALVERYAPEFPTVTQLPALELSVEAPHVCAYGGAVTLPAEDAGPPVTMPERIQAQGGVAAYAHPFGVAGRAVVQAEQPELRRAVVETLSSTQAYGCTALEVGYRQRGGADLASHESVWDACSRQGIFLTGLGVNDNHSGMNWANHTNNFVTWLWSASTGEDDLLGAMRSGHAYFGDPVLFSGQLDIRVGPSGHMGMAVARQGATTDVRLVAAGLPPGSELEILRIDMDGSATPADPDQAVITRYLVAELPDGEVQISLPTATDCLVRTRVRVASGEVVALSNPLWVMADPVATQVPQERRPLTADDASPSQVTSP